MNEPTSSTANEATGRCWRLAWFAVWSPVAAWVGAVVGLLLAGRFQVSEVAAAAGLTIGFCGLVGVFVVVPCALDSLLATLDAPGMTARERSRLAYLSLFGTMFSLLGYGCLMVLGGFVLMVSPFVGLQL